MEKYLREEVHPVFEALITALLLKVPRGKDLMPFCVDWLRKRTEKEQHTDRSLKTERNSED